MTNIVDVVLIAGFLAVDFLLFHDIFKVGEAITGAQYLVGILSIIVIARALQSLLKK
ncbi:hypothetical protein BH11PAT2_BH11PAT2_01300 [soil metagenome]